MRRGDRTLGAMLGLAVGDALGAQVEFADPGLARAVVARGVEMVDSRYWTAGQWTDDTALALELAESIAASGLLDLDDLARRYIRWATTDGRGIGRATRAALVGASDATEARRRAAGFHTRTGMGAGNGTVMRCTPIGLAARDLDEARAAAVEDARLTHGHPAAATASAATCAALLALRTGADPLAAAVAESPHEPELAHALELAAADDRDALSVLAIGPAAGACWTTIAIALCALTHVADTRTASPGQSRLAATRTPTRRSPEPCSASDMGWTPSLYVGSSRSRSVTGLSASPLRSRARPRHRTNATARRRRNALQLPQRTATAETTRSRCGSGKKRRAA